VAAEAAKRHPPMLYLDALIETAHAVVPAATKKIGLQNLFPVDIIAIRIC
jgi:hypothetical protein